MKTPYNYIIDFHFSNGLDYSGEVNSIMMLKNHYIQKLTKNRLLKWEREQLILLLNLLDD